MSGEADGDANMAPFFVVVPKEAHRPDGPVLAICCVSRKHAERTLKNRTSPSSEWHVLEVVAWREVTLDPA